MVKTVDPNIDGSTRSNSYALSEPPPSFGLLEFRALKDLATLPVRLSSIAFKKTENLGQGRVVLVLPGFGVGDASMLPLRFYLKRHGFKPVGWGLGVNKAGLNLKHNPNMISWDLEFPDERDRSVDYRGEAGVPYLSELVVKKVKSLADIHQMKISLVGWSLGGTIAREVARDLPESVEHVVTMGAPIIGGPKYTRAAGYLRQRGLNLDWIEQEVARRNQTPIACKVSAIVSRSDGIVDWSASVDPADKSTRFIEKDLPHLGMGINQMTMQLVLDELVGV